MAKLMRLGKKVQLPLKVEAGRMYQEVSVWRRQSALRLAFQYLRAGVTLGKSQTNSERRLVLRQVPEQKVDSQPVSQQPRL